MASAAIELWLIAQMIIEVILCAIIIYYVLRERGSRQEKRKERERTKALIQALDRLIIESEDFKNKIEEIELKKSKIETLWEDYPYAEATQ